MLPVGAILQDYGPDGWTKFTKDEQITMMSLWSIMRSPLMIGGEMTKFDDFTMSLLTNADLIDCLNNTHSAHPLFRKTVDGGEQIAWFTSCTDGKSYYIALFNCGEKECSITAELPIDCTFSAREIWTGAVNEVSGEITAFVKPHGAAMFRLTRV